MISLVQFLLSLLGLFSSSYLPLLKMTEHIRTSCTRLPWLPSLARGHLVSMDCLEPPKGAWKPSKSYHAFKLLFLSTLGLLLVLPRQKNCRICYRISSTIWIIWTIFVDLLSTFRSRFPQVKWMMTRFPSSWQGRHLRGPSSLKLFNTWVILLRPTRSSREERLLVMAFLVVLNSPKDSTKKNRFHENIDS